MKFFLFTTTLFSGLIAGVFFAYSCSVNIALKHLTNTEYIKVMQSINVAIQNPVFLLTFMGLLILFPVVVFGQYSIHADSRYLLVAALSIYFVLVFGVTAFGNIPLNNHLADFQLSKATEAETYAMRTKFENPWNTFHTIRTIGSIASFGLMILFLIKQKH